MAADIPRFHFQWRTQEDGIKPFQRDCIVRPTTTRESCQSSPRLTGLFYCLFPRSASRKRIRSLLAQERPPTSSVPQLFAVVFFFFIIAVGSCPTKVAKLKKDVFPPVTEVKKKIFIFYLISVAWFLVDCSSDSFVWRSQVLKDAEMIRSVSFL